MRAVYTQTVSELAIMMDMKKVKVAETAKEHRADELSAMFNLMMDRKRAQRGLLPQFLLVCPLQATYRRVMTPCAVFPRIEAPGLY